MKNNKGITLIALVVTIIVLLILAGVSIAMLTGQNGILNRASEASYKSKLTDASETISFTITNNLTDYYNNAYASKTGSTNSVTGSTASVADTIKAAIDSCVTVTGAEAAVKKGTVNSDKTVSVELSDDYKVTDGTAATEGTEATEDSIGGTITLTYNSHSRKGIISNAGIVWEDVK